MHKIVWLVDFFSILVKYNKILYCIFLFLTAVDNEQSESMPCDATLKQLVLLWPWPFKTPFTEWTCIHSAKVLKILARTKPIQNTAMDICELQRCVRSQSCASNAQHAPTSEWGRLYSVFKMGRGVWLFLGSWSLGILRNSFYLHKRAIIAPAVAKML